MRQVSIAEAKQMALDAKDSLWGLAHQYGRDVKIYLHWTAGWYDQVFGEYTFSIDGNGNIYVSTDDLSEVGDHTYRRNSGSIGIALCCCANATSNDLGEAPPTDAQIEAMSILVAVLAKALDLSIDLQRVMTHGEAADNLDGIYCHAPYGPDSTCERWDLAILKNCDEWKSGGDTLRGKANWYNDNYPDGVENHF
jgi:hypothetical protein